MALLPRGADDILLDHFVAVSNAFSTAQKVFDSTMGFFAYRDETLAPGADDILPGPWVNFSIDSENPDVRGGSRDQRQQVVTVKVDLITASKEQASGADGGQKAMARLLYLKEQIIAAVYNLSDYDFSAAIGVLQLVSYRYQFLGRPTETTEQYVVGGQLSIDVRLSRALPDRTLINLTDVGVTVAKDTGPTGTRWSGLYHVSN